MPSTEDNGRGSAKQVNVRVSQMVGDVLEAAVYVREFRGMQDLVAPELERFASALRDDPKVVAVVQAREQRRLEETS
jgi:hypothetical protein